MRDLLKDGLHWAIPDNIWPPPPMESKKMPNKKDGIPTKTGLNKMSGIPMAVDQKILEFQNNSDKNVWNSKGCYQNNPGIPRRF